MSLLNIPSTPFRGTTMFHEIDEHVASDSVGSSHDEMKVVTPPEKKFSVCRVVCGTTVFQEIDEHMTRE